MSLAHIQKPAGPAKRFFCGPLKNEIISTKIKGAKIYISATHYWDALFIFMSTKRFLKRAERTAELMKRANKLSSQCLQEWANITFCLEHCDTDELTQGQKEDNPSHYQEVETTYHNAGK